MGVTHYWRRPTELPPETFRAAVIDVHRLFSVEHIEVAGFDGTGSPIVSEDRVILNGRAPLACEPLEITAIEFDPRGRSEVRSFCKTELLPYDLCVKAVLVVFQHHLHSHFVVTSDQQDTDWTAARELVQSALGYGQAFCLAKE